MSSANYVPWSAVQAVDLRQMIEGIAELLPSQGPIDVFVHHNTLHAFEDLPFEVAVEQGGLVYGAEVFLPEQRYLEEYRRGRITDRDLDAVIAAAVNEKEGLGDLWLRDVIKTFLVVSPPVEGFQEVKWLLRESQEMITRQGVLPDDLRAWLTRREAACGIHSAFHRFNAEAAEGLQQILRSISHDESIVDAERTILWAASLLLSVDVADYSAPPVEDAASQISDELINPLVIRFCEEYLDLGLSSHLMPGRRTGMLRCFFDLIRRGPFGVPTWLEPLRDGLDRYEAGAASPLELLRELLNERRLSDEECRRLLLRQALSLRGWAGFISLAEHRPELLHGQHDEIRPTFVEYLVIRLMLLRYAEQSHLLRTRLSESIPESPEITKLDEVYCFAYHVLVLFCSLRRSGALLSETGEVKELVSRLWRMDRTMRRRLWHRAYENNLYTRALDVVAKKAVWHRAEEETADAQFVFCIDDREESIRRHLEAIRSQYKTFGTAGFFGVDANYTMMSGASAPYCPVIIKPTHAIREVPRQGFERVLSRYRKKQQTWFRFSGFVNKGSGRMVHNAILSLAGCVALVPMVLGVIAPRTFRFMGKWLGSEPNIPPELHELQVGIDDGASGELPGYTTEEMADRVIAVLRSIGLVERLAPLILLIGHGSSSRNNPLRSAYDCGACGGRPGRINARAFSLMANNPRVRELVYERSGIAIPSTTHFIGAFHNTCSDQIEYFDLSLVPEAHHRLLEQVQQDLTRATKENAFERCRRFGQAHVTDVEQAAEEALSRSFMVAEARPEYGHATNALCIVGPRQFSKDIFFDRRCFLVSYDHSLDHEAAILLGILRAVVPVCGGINLEYLFSAMDNEVYGAGTKLPHNIVSLVGIMNGTSSDLRTGLPTQMVEIHEPVRLLLVVVTTREKLNSVVSSDPAISRTFAGEWIKVVLANTEAETLEWRLPSGDYVTYEPTEESPPIIDDFRSFFRGRTGHLPFSEIAVQGGAR